MAVVRRLIIELTESTDAVLRSLSAQSGDNETTTINHAIVRYAILVGLRDDEGRVEVLAPPTGPWWRRKQRVVWIKV